MWAVRVVLVHQMDRAYVLMFISLICNGLSAEFCVMALYPEESGVSSYPGMQESWPEAPVCLGVASLAPALPGKAALVPAWGQRWQG